MIDVFLNPYFNNKNNIPKNVEQMYSEIWLPDLLDSEKWLSSLFSILLNCKCNTSNECAIVSA